jgi:PAS domain-containing protein
MPTKFDDGSIVWDSLILDITREKDALFDRDRSRMAIKESEEKYRNLFELSPLPKWLYNHETYQIIDVNEASLRLYG